MEIKYQIGIENDNQKEFLIRETAIFFAQFDSDNNAREYILNKVNFDLSILCKKENEIIGFYLLSDKNNILNRQYNNSADIKHELKFYEDLNKYKGKKGLEGVALLVQNKYRGLGIGKKLISKSIELARSQGCKYIFGGQLKTLKNLKHWLRSGRILVAESEVLNITLINLESDVHEKILFAKESGAKFLDLSGLELFELPDELFTLNSLEHLILNYNKLESLPSDIGRLNNLKRLSIIGNQLTLLPIGIINLHKLEYLNLARNKISLLPQNIGYLKDLEEMILAENEVSILPKTISSSRKLVFLDLSFNLFRRVPSHILQLTNLSTLDLSHNKISFLSPEEAEKLRKLNSLRLEGNLFAKNIDYIIAEEEPKETIEMILEIQEQVDSLESEKNKWMNIISSGDIDGAILEVKKYLSSTNNQDLKNEMAIISSQFSQIKSQSRIGVLQFEEYNISLNKVMNRLVQLITIVE